MYLCGVTLTHIHYLCYCKEMQRSWKIGHIIFVTIINKIQFCSDIDLYELENKLALYLGPYNKKFHKVLYKDQYYIIYDNSSHCHIPSRNMKNLKDIKKWK